MVRGQGTDERPLIASRRDQSARLFQNDWLERLSQVHPIVPHLLYLPAIAGSLVLASRSGIAPGALVGWLALGILAWTLFEYLIHRFVLHANDETERRTAQAVRRQAPDRPILAVLGWRDRAYFLMHGVHHLFPNDSRRLVMPPSVSLPLAVIFAVGFRLALGPGSGPAAFAGFVAGYLAYDTTHFAVHHSRSPNRWLAYLKKWHMRHHFVDSRRRFGVSSPLWDYVFATASVAGQGDAGKGER